MPNIQPGGPPLGSYWLFLFNTLSAFFSSGGYSVHFILFQCNRIQQKLQLKTYNVFIIKYINLFRNYWMTCTFSGSRISSLSVFYVIADVFDLLTFGERIGLNLINLSLTSLGGITLHTSLSYKTVLVVLQPMLPHFHPVFPLIH